MKKDLEIQENVMEELKWTPLLNANEIGVAVKNGIVTLSGVVDSYPKKIKAERAAQKVAGVKGIAEDIEVRLNENEKKTDTELAQAVLYELEWHSNLDPQKIKVFVEGGIVTLQGDVNWNFQRHSASKAVWNIKGVKGIFNNIKVAAVAVPSDLKTRIDSAFRRNANLDARNIMVGVQGHKVFLSGSVKCWSERREAEKAVWSAPGVNEIDNQIACEEPGDLV
jgi:osmotically-inducible protein OsmY